MNQSAEGTDPEARCNMKPCGQEEECQLPQCTEMGASFDHSAEGCSERMYACHCDQVLTTTEGRSKHERNTKLSLHE